MTEIVLRLDEGGSTVQIVLKGSPEKLSQFMKDLVQFSNSWLYMQNAPKPSPCKSCNAD